MATRTVVLTHAMFAFWEETSPGWVCLIGLDREATEKVIFLMEEPKARDSREMARANGGVQIIINEAQVVLTAPDGKEGT